MNEFLAKIAITPRVTGLASYEILDLVAVNGRSYLSLVNGNVSVVTDETNWLKMTDNSYDVAVRLGYVGTEVQWITSLSAASIEAAALANAAATSANTAAAAANAATANMANTYILKTAMNLVNNTSDANKPVSTAQQTALNLKVDKVAGKSLILDTEITRLLGVTNQTLAGLAGEATANKSTNMKTDALSDIKFPSVKAVVTEMQKRPEAVEGVYPYSALPPAYLGEDIYAYGIQYDLSTSSPILSRVGNPSYHASLPVQSLMKGCLLLDNGAVNYYLYPSDWTLKADGVTPSKLDGTDGQVMIELPRYYRKFQYTSSTLFRCMLSLYPLQGYSEIKKKYISAFEATVQRSNLKLSSVMNLAIDFRGGCNDASKDALVSTQLGKAATDINPTNFRLYARNRNIASTEWNQLTYEIYKDVTWLYYVEFANLNCQLPVLAKDGNGYATGGLGNGVTTADSTKWGNFNGYYPIVNCGASNILGNNSGEVAVSVTDFGGVGVPQIFTVPRYRGIENIFGHIWKFADGIIVDVKKDADGGTSTVFTSSIPANFSSVSTANYANRGQESRIEGYIKTMLLGATGEIMSSTVGGGSTTYWCDYHYTNLATSELRCVLFGGAALHTSSAGLGYSATHSAFSIAAAAFGSRLCFLPA